MRICISMRSCVYCTMHPVVLLNHAFTVLISFICLNGCIFSIRCWSAALTSYHAIHPSQPEPYTLQPGQAVRMYAAYDASEPYAGVMSFLNVMVTDFSLEGCTVDFRGFIQAS